MPPNGSQSSLLGSRRRYVRENCPSATVWRCAERRRHQFFRPEPLTIQGENSLVFTGAMNYFPNVKAVEFFCGQYSKDCDKRTTIHWLAAAPLRRFRRSMMAESDCDWRSGGCASFRSPQPDLRRTASAWQWHSAENSRGFRDGQGGCSTSIGAEGIPPPMAKS